MLPSSQRALGTAPGDAGAVFGDASDRIHSDFLVVHCPAACCSADYSAARESWPIWRNSLGYFSNAGSFGAGARRTMVFWMVRNCGQSDVWSVHGGESQGESLGGSNSGLSGENRRCGKRLTPRPARCEIRSGGSCFWGNHTCSPNQVFIASSRPSCVPSPTQATYPSGRISTADGAETGPSAGSSHGPAYLA